MDSRLTPSPADTAARLGLDINGIMWTDATVNPGLFGCAKVSPACLNCYAEEMAARIVRMGGPAAARYAQGLTDGRWNGRVAVSPEVEPFFRKIPWTVGKIRRVFVTSMSDLFHEDVPFDFIDLVFVEMAARPQVFQVLTKRADRMAAYARQRALPWPANIWAGVTVEDQRRADERIPHLLQVPAAVRFLSIEPMLGAIDLSRWMGEYTCYGCGYRGNDISITGNDDRDEVDACPECGTQRGGGFGDAENDPRTTRDGGISWVIVGSESDGPRPGKRETQDAWVLGLVDQCDAANVPVFCKQLTIDGRLCFLPRVDGKVRADFPLPSPPSPDTRPDEPVHTAPAGGSSSLGDT